MSEIIYSQCPICGSPHIEPFQVAQDYTVSQQIFRIDICRDCHTAFTQGVPDEAHIGAFYKSDTYISHSDTQKGLFNKTYHKVRNYMLGRKRRLIENLQPTISEEPKQLLDIGCGTGYFLDTMRKGGWKVSGIEPDDDARHFGKQNFSLEIDSPEKLNALPNASFEVITLWHVLEHIHRIHEYMQHIRRLLTEKGKVIIAVPNYKSKDAYTYGEDWAGWDVPRHLWHFSPLAMQNLAIKHGFDISYKEAMPFDPFYVALLSEKYRKNELAPLSGFWRGAMSFLSAQKNVNNASSIIYVLQPNWKYSQNNERDQ
ncbi:MAG: class I SAM-dependent methyltransferase [Bernardetiaceae bacterium]|nr:class I SAM-dependent methyltransferase [Bernardetiaceae bacterium]